MSDIKPAQVPWLSYAKKAAVAAFAGATGVLGVLVVAVTASSDGGTHITTPEWLQAAIVGLTAIGGSLGVYYASNQARPTALKHDTGWKNEAGYTGLVNALVAIVALIVLVWLVVFIVRALTGA